MNSWGGRDLSGGGAKVSSFSSGPSLLLLLMCFALYLFGVVAQAEVIEVVQDNGPADKMLVPVVALGVGVEVLEEQSSDLAEPPPARVLRMRGGTIVW